jgi:hypothetical protein
MNTPIVAQTRRFRLICRYCPTTASDLVVCPSRRFDLNYIKPTLYVLSPPLVDVDLLAPHYVVTEMDFDMTLNLQSITWETIALINWTKVDEVVRSVAQMIANQLSSEIEYASEWEKVNDKEVSFRLIQPHIDYKERL